MNRRLDIGDVAGLVALVAICALAGVVTSRLVEDWWEPATALLAAASAVVLTAVLERSIVPTLRRRTLAPARVALVLVGALVAAVIATTVVHQILDRPQSSGVLESTGDALIHGWSAIVTAPVPSAASPRLVVPIAVAVWCVASCAAMLALRRRSSDAPDAAGPLLPCVALLAAACLAAGAEQPSGRLVGAAALAACGIVLVTRTAARRTTRTDGDQGESIGLRTAAPLLAATVAIGLVAGPVLALGRDDEPFDPRDRLVAPVVDADATNPLDIVAIARSRPESTLFTVTASGPAPIRIASLDHFDGARWTSSGEFERARVTFEQRDRINSERMTTAEFRLIDYEGPWLPSIDLPTALRGADVLIDTDSSSFVAAGDVSPGLTYEVTAALENVDVAVLRNGLPVARDDIAQRALQLPDGIPVPVRELAEGIIAGAPSAFDEALLINSHLTRTLRVESDRAGGHSFGHLTDVLFTTGVASEEQLATTFALLARSVGLPTRVTVGVDLAVVDAAGTYDITGADLRAWPEVRFDDVGWVAFRLDVDRIDSTGAVLVGLDDTADAVRPEFVDTADVDDAPADAPLPSPDSGATNEPVIADSADTDANTDPDSDSDSSSPGALDPADGITRLASAALIAVAVLVWGAVVVVIMKRRRTRRRRSLADPRRSVIAAWDDLLERLHEVEPDAPNPRMQTVEQVIETHRGTGTAITAMYRPVSRALYHDGPVGAADVDQVWQARDRFVTSVGERSSLRCRVQRAVDPRVLRPRKRATSTDRSHSVDTVTGGHS